MPKAQPKPARGAKRAVSEKARPQSAPLTDASTVSKARKRVAIIGGGCAGIAAAWQLAKNPEYEVSVYERSGRLGGKGESQRAADGRILEHGLHVWLGFYENAFRMMRECYQEVEKRNWGPRSKDEEGRLAHGSFEDAFFAEPHIGVTGHTSGQNVVWSGFLPPEKGLPGDPIDADTNPFTLANYLLRSVHLLKALMLSVIAHPAEDVPGAARPEARSTLDETIDLDFSLDPTRSPELLIESIAGRVRDGALTIAAAMLQAVTIFENILQDLNHSPQAVGSVLHLMTALAGQTRKQLRDLVAIDEKLRWKTEIIDIVMTIAVGLYRDRVLLGSKGLDAINDIDYREWLLKHGATKTALRSRFITGIYDLVFAYENGDRTKPRLAAGVALRGALRMFFTYRGAMFWRMRSGMGDAVFAPLYKVMMLSDRKDPRSGAKLSPVTFHFLHELSQVTFDMTDSKRRFVTELRFTTPGGDVRESAGVLDHFGCWPEGKGDRKPISQGERILKVEDDFDAVIFATGLEDFSEIANGKKGKGIVEDKAPPPWRRALTSRRQTVATKAAQVWLADDLEELGWYRGPAVVAALGLPFDTWADMTHTLPSERAWRDAQRSPKAGRASAARLSAVAARSVAYFCGVLSEEEIKKGEHRDVKLEESLGYLLEGMSRLWPAAARDATKLKPLQHHVQSNVAGSGRYSLSLPGTIRNRLSPLDRSVLNMTVAGDWTACGLDAGCVEAAVMSGMLAAHAITGTEPALDSIIGYDHP
jgi:uncharacterized protein with NAD-binding domain and iron-sulfur cluster